MSKFILKVLEDIKEELGISYEVLSNNWVIKITKENNSIFITDYKFPLNNHSIGMILDDKYALYEALKSANIKVTEYNLLYSSNNKSEYAINYNDYYKVTQYFEKNNNHIVIKVNNGTCGNGVYEIREKKDIIPLLSKMFLNNYSISYSPYYDIETEYRVIVLNKKVKVVYGKKRPIVYGDGKTSIRDLLLKFNRKYFIDKLNDSIYDEVIPKNKKFIYDWKFNLSKGSVAFQVNDKKLIGNLEVIALECVNKLNLDFVSVDIIKTTRNELYVLEINSGVMMENYINFFKDGYEKVKDIYKEAIIKSFEAIK
ncbi:MAG: hypothetical protein IJ094_07805 [Bacilli bacterium]|nr:hypothetical protein [Bacilli bacterium]